jgi:hypothetical protein
MSSDKSLDELLSLLGPDGVKPDKTGKDDVELFIEDLNIKAAETEKVSARIIYWFYMKWKEAEQGIDGVIYSRRQFFRRFVKHFKSGCGIERHYKIESGKFKLTRWEKEELQRDLDQSLKEEKTANRKRLREKERRRKKEI